MNQGQQDILDAVAATKHAVQVPRAPVGKKITAPIVDLTGVLQKTFDAWIKRWFKLGMLPAGYRVEIMISTNDNYEPPQRLTLDVGPADQTDH